MAAYGYTGDGASEDATDNTQVAYKWKYTGKTGGVISSGSWRGRRSSGSGTSTVYLALYSDNNLGKPADRLDLISASVSLDTNITRYTINDAGSYPLVNGVTYWIAAASDLGVGWRCEYDSDATVDFSYKTPQSGAPTDPWGTETGNNTWKMAFYLNIDESGGTDLELVTTAVFAATNGTTGGTFLIPTVSVDDDLFVLFTSRDHTSGTARATCTDDEIGGNAWTRLAESTDRKANLYWRKATADTSAARVTVAGAVGSCSGGMMVIRGAPAGDPTTDISVEDNASADESHAEFTPANANSMICFAIFDTGNDTNVVTLAGCTTPGKLPEIWSRLSSGGSDCRTQQYLGAQAGGPTATGAFTWAQTNSTTKSIAWAIQPAVTGITEPVDQATETDETQAIGKLKAKAVAQVTETESAETVTAVRRIPIVQCNETDATQAITFTKQKTAAQISETDEALAITVQKNKAIAQVTETDAAEDIAILRGRVLTQVTETDSAAAISVKKVKEVSQCTETAETLTVAPRKSRAITQALELDEAQEVVSSGPKIRLLTQATETETAGAIKVVKTRTLTQSLETEAAEALAVLKALTLSQAAETDEALDVLFSTDQFIPLAGVLETDLAQTIFAMKFGGISRTIDTSRRRMISDREREPIFDDEGRTVKSSKRSAVESTKRRSIT